MLTRFKIQISYGEVVLFQKLKFEQDITRYAKSLWSDSTGQTEQIRECICEMWEVKHWLYWTPHLAHLDFF